MRSAARDILPLDLCLPRLRKVKSGPAAHTARISSAVYASRTYVGRAREATEDFLENVDYPLLVEWRI